MADVGGSLLILSINPIANRSGQLVQLQTSLLITRPVALHPGDVLCETDKAIVPGSGAVVSAVDHHGELVLHPDPPRGERTTYQWQVERAAQGHVRIDTMVRATANSEACIDISALRQDSGGIVGLGRGFLARPVGLSNPLILTLQWGLAGLPSTTRPMSSLMSGFPGRKSVVSFEEVLDAVYMVGPIYSFRLLPTEAGHEEPSQAMVCTNHWLGDLSPKFDIVKEFHVNMFPHLSAFFGDEHGSFRAFLRKIPNGLQGYAARGCSLIDYGDEIENEEDWELIRVAVRGMLASWARLDPEDDGTSNDWYSKGLSSLYSIYLPFRFGFQTSDYFRATLNGILSGYFTNPLLHAPATQRQDEQYSWYIESFSYLQACVYMIRIDCLMRRASKNQGAGVERPIDEIAAALSTQRRSGGKAHAQDWIKRVGAWIGEANAAQHLRNLREGVATDFEDMHTIFGGIVREDQDILEFGFDRSSLDKGVVTGLVEGSRAAEAGLLDGDVIMWHSRPEVCITGYDKMFRVRVERAGSEVEIEYWPRGRTTLPVWQSRKKT